MTLIDGTGFRGHRRHRGHSGGSHGGGSSYVGGAIDNGENLTLTNVTISGNTSDSGGGIYNSGSLTLTDSSISGNVASNYGGGIYNDGSLTLINSTISGNTSFQGGGIYNADSLTLINSTISGNTSNYGGGIYNTGALSVTNTTISDNSAVSGGGIFTITGGLNGGNPANLANTIVAGNTATDLTADVNGAVTGSNNLIGDGTGMTGLTNNDAGHNQVGNSGSPIDPKLGPLADNGGPTQTMALLAGSPAIDAGDNDLARDANGFSLITDQRGVGFSRIENGTVDIGTFEVESVATTTVVAASPNPSTYGDSVTFTATITSTATPTGSVEFVIDSGTPIVGIEGSTTGTTAIWTFTTSTLTAGTRTVEAEFVGAGIFLASEGCLSGGQVVKKAASTTTVTINGGPFTYTGLAQTPATVTVKGPGGLSLMPTASYTNNVNAGTATASFTFAGDANHLGSNGSKTFTISPITLTASGTNFAAVAGTAVTAAVASFPNLDPVGTISSYTATICWGDGTPSSAGVIANAGGGVFTVTGTHTYANAGSDSFSVTITHKLGNTTTAVANGVATVKSKTGSIQGHVYQDLTGNGMTSDDTGLAGITVYIDANKNGSLNSGDPTAVTDANGMYTFSGLVAGTYVVRENLPSSYVRTGPTLADNYTVALATGANSTGNDFDDFRLLNTSVTSNIKYTINGTTSVSDLRGNTDQGDLVQVTFTVAANVTNFPVSLVSYTAPAATFDATTAAQQKIFELATGTFSTGTYTLTVTLPNSFYQVDFVAGAAIDTFGPANSNIFYSAQSRLFSADNDGTQAVLPNASSLAGIVFSDSNNDGVQQAGEAGLGLVQVTLTGKDNKGNNVSLTRFTEPDGSYLFDNLAPAGSKGYTITEQVVDDYFAGINTIGTSVAGVVGSESFSSLVLGTGVIGQRFNFAELPEVTSNQVANVSFWNGTSGQNLIKSFNGGSTSKSLATWLASNFANIYGSSAGANSLVGKTNADVAALFKKLDGSSSTQLDAQVLATALNVYATTTSLGGSAGTSYGFLVTANGLGASYFSVESDGSAFGVSNNTVESVWSLLLAVNSRASSGKLYYNSSTQHSQALDLFGDLN